jgi:peptidyl-prolyl cis-trans isomerase D
MLQAIRERAQGIFAWVLLILIGVPFAFWGIQNYFDSGEERPVAVVGDHSIYERDINRAYEQSMQSLAGLGQFEEKEIKRQSLERLIREELIGEAADRQTLRISDDGVRDFLQALPYFQTDGVFDKEKYRQMLAAQNLSPAQYTEQVRKALAMEQYQRSVTDSVLLPDQQVRELYRLKNQQRAIDYVTVPLHKGEQAVGEPEAAAYYEQHRSEFREPETVSVDYLVLTLDELASAVKPSDTELRTFYDEQKAVFTTEERRRVSHILVAADAGNAEADKTALAKIQVVRERLSKGEAFDRVAREQSEDPASAAKGGDLGLLGSGTMDPEFEKAAKSIGKDQLSAPVRTPFGYHLIKVTSLEPATVKSFEQVTPELVKMFQRNAADGKFYELGQRLTELSFEHPDTLEPAAKAIGKAVQTSAPFRRESGEGVANTPAIRDAAFSDDVLNGKNSDLIEVSPEEVAVIRVRDHRPAADRPLDSVRAEIVQRIKRERSQEETRTVANEFIKALEGGASLASQAKGASLAVKSPPPIRREATEVPEPVVTAVFAAPKPRDSKPVSGIVALEDGAQALYQLKSVIEAAPGAADQEMDQLKDYLIKNLGQRQFAAWIDELRRVSDVKISRSDP